MTQRTDDELTAKCAELRAVRDAARAVAVSAIRLHADEKIRFDKEREAKYHKPQREAEKRTREARADNRPDKVKHEKDNRRDLAAALAVREEAHKALCKVLEANRAPKEKAAGNAHKNWRLMEGVKYARKVLKGSDMDDYEAEAKKHMDPEVASWLS